MNSKSEFLSDPKKKIAAANYFDTTQSMEPPELSLTYNGSQSQNTLATNSTGVPTIGGQNSAQETQDQSLNEQESQSQNQSESPEYSTNLNSGHAFASVLDALHVFRSSSFFTNVTINSTVAIGKPGCLHAISIKGYLESLLKAEAQNSTDLKISSIVADVISSRLDTWKNHLTIPGLPFYPAFSAFPGAHAPPMPNIPFPLALFPNPFNHMLQDGGSMASEMISKLPEDLRTQENLSYIYSLCGQTAGFFSTWLVTTMVRNVMGHGPIPTFAPPIVPVGPVINGSVIPTSGVLL